MILAKMTEDELLEQFERELDCYLSEDFFEQIFISTKRSSNLKLSSLNDLSILNDLTGHYLEIVEQPFNFLKKRLSKIKDIDLQNMMRAMFIVKLEELAFQDKSDGVKCFDIFLSQTYKQVKSVFKELVDYFYENVSLKFTPVDEYNFELEAVGEEKPCEVFYYLFDVIGEEAVFFEYTHIARLSSMWSNYFQNADISNLDDDEEDWDEEEDLEELLDDEDIEKFIEEDLCDIFEKFNNKSESDDDE